MERQHAELMARIDALCDPRPYFKARRFQTVALTLDTLADALWRQAIDSAAAAEQLARVAAAMREVEPPLAHGDTRRR